MPWFYVDDGFASSKPVMAIPKPIRAQAIGVWTLCGSWSAKELTDGSVPMEIVKQCGGTPRIIAALVDNARLWDRIPAENSSESDRILFRNWSKWQKTRAEVLEKRRQEAERKKRWRKGRTSEDSETSTRDTFGDKYTNGDECPRGTPALPDPTRPLVVTNRVCSPVGSDPASAHTKQAPPKFCEAHPQGTAKRCGDCANARRVLEAWEADQAENSKRLADVESAARAVDRAMIEACPDCDQNGFAEDDDGYASRCEHPSLTRSDFYETRRYG